jgi:hypothetical protein
LPGPVNLRPYHLRFTIEVYMGPEVAAEAAQALAHERLPFEGIDHTTLIDQFLDADGQDQALGRELGIRLMEHAGIADPTTTPLMGSNGEQVGDLVLADYVIYAAAHHAYALGDILGFLELDPERDAEDHATMREVMVERLTSNKA